jgi:biopolymer transport protein ExbD
MNMGTVSYMRHYRVAPSNGQPIAAMNITPLIDVMLVLLVMLIITLPMTYHQVDVDLPAPGPTAGREPVTQKLVLRNDGTAYWNGTAMDDGQLGEKLRATAVAGDDLQFQTESLARYERFNNLIGLVRQSGVTKIGFVGNSQFAKWDQPSV